MSDINNLLQSASGCHEYYAIGEFRSWCQEHLGYVPPIGDDNVYVRDQSDVTLIQMIYPKTRWDIVVDPDIVSMSELDERSPHWVVRDLEEAPRFRIKMQNLNQR